MFEGMASDEKAQLIGQLGHAAEKAAGFEASRVRVEMQQEGAGQRAADRLATLEESLGIKKDNQTAAAKAKVVNDKDLVSMTGTSRNIFRGMHTLAPDKARVSVSNPTGAVTVTEAHEVLQDFAAALSQGKIASDFKLKSISPKMLQEMSATFDTLLSSDPNQPAPPEQVKFLQNFGTRLGGAYKTQVADRARALRTGLTETYKNNPTAAEVAGKALDLYENGEWMTPVDHPPQTKLSPEERARRIKFLESSRKTAGYYEGGLVPDRRPPPQGGSSKKKAEPSAWENIKSNLLTGSAASSTASWSGGGIIPGRAPEAGDEPENDIVVAHVSPGEMIIPRSIVKAGHKAIALFAEQELAAHHKKSRK
jgi:hypothetical protein